MLAAGRRSFRASRSGRTGSPARPKNEDRRKAFESAGKGPKKSGVAKMPAKSVPAQRTDRVATVDRKQPQQQQPAIGLGDRVSQFCEAEILHVHRFARAIRQREEHGKDQNRKEDFAKVPTHSSARLSGSYYGVKKRGRGMFAIGGDVARFDAGNEEFMRALLGIHGGTWRCAA